MKSVTTHEAKTHLSALLQEVCGGAEIEIRRGDEPVALLVPVGAKVRRRRPRVGVVTSAPVRLDADAFAPLDDEGMKALGLL